MQGVTQCSGTASVNFLDCSAVVTRECFSNIISA